MQQLHVLWHGRKSRGRGKEARRHTGEISGSHGSENEDDSLLGCWAV
jgi:hypothetical protein